MSHIAIHALGIGIASLGIWLMPATSSKLMAQIYPNRNASPLYGNVYLRAGFTPSPLYTSIDAGGYDNVSDMRLGNSCTGFINASQPDYRLNYDADYSGNTQLVFNTYANVDTTLVINGPDGRWYCNDDFNGRDPQVLLTRPLSGQYDIWVGVFGHSQVSDAQLAISEQRPIYTNLPSQPQQRPSSFPSSSQATTISRREFRDVIVNELVSQGYTTAQVTPACNCIVGNLFETYTTEQINAFAQDPMDLVNLAQPITEECLAFHPIGNPQADQRSTPANNNNDPLGEALGILFREIFD